jgi:hypothetical protein
MLVYINSNILALSTFSLLNTLEKFLVNVWEHTTVCDGGLSKEFVKFLIISDGQEDVPRVDSVLLVVFSSISS